MWPACATIVLWFALGHPAAPLSPAAAEARTIVKQLGAGTFKARERAAAKLVEIGDAAVFPVRQGERDADAEVAERCRKLRPAVEETSRAQRLKVFITDHHSHPGRLPGAVRFLGITGDTPQARSVYAEMFRGRPDILEAVEVDRRAGRRLASRWIMEDALVNPAWYVIPLYLTLASDDRLRGEFPDNAFPNWESMIGAIRWPYVAPERSQNRRLFLHWLANERIGNAQAAGFRAAVTMKLKEAVPIAETCAADPEYPLSARCQAILALGALGDRRHEALLERIRTGEESEMSTSITVTGGEITSVSVTANMVAMGALCRMRGFDLKVVGFGLPKGFDYPPDDYHFYAFSTGRARALTVLRFEELSRGRKK